MYFGCHVSVAGGIEKAPAHASALGCEVFQFFSRSPQGGPAPKLTDEAVAAFLARCTESSMQEWVIHAPYYINFASGLARTRGNSIRIIREELERASLLQARYVMFHPGSAKDVGHEEGLKLTIEGVKQVLNGYDGTAQLLIEISAGAGMVIGASFEDVATLIDGIGHPDLGVCFDTAHAFASGYDLRTEDAVKATLASFDEAIGLSRLKMSHCNDSKVALGERKDRHEHLGQGHIGVEGFRALMHHPVFSKLNFYLETDHDAVAQDLALLKTLRA